MNNQVREFLERFERFAFTKPSRIPTEAEMIYEETEKIKKSAEKKKVLLDDVMLKGVVFLSVKRRILGWSFLLSGGDFPPQSHEDILRRPAIDFCASIMAEKGYITTYQSWADPEIIKKADELYNFYVTLAAN